MSGRTRVRSISVAVGALTGAALIATLASAQPAPLVAHQTPTLSPSAGPSLPIIPGDFGDGPIIPMRMHYADGSATARVLSSPAFEALWSPTDRWIAYLQSANGRIPKIMLANADGSGARQIFRGIEVVGWSPDGLHLLVQKSRTTFRILRISESGQVSGRRPVPARPGTRYETVAWAGPNTLIATGTVRRQNVVMQAKLGGPRPRVLMRARAKVIAANASGMALLKRNERGIIRLPGGRTVSVGRGAFALTPDGRVLAFRSNPSTSKRWNNRLVEVNPRRGSTRVIRENVRSATASHDGRVIAIQQAVRDRQGEPIWAITTIDSNGQNIKHLAVVGDSLGEPATIVSGDDPLEYPWALTSPSSDGQRALIQTPFRLGG